MSLTEETLEEARYCRKCNTVATFLEEAIEECYERGECLKISCADAGCGKNWIYCKSCKRRFNSTNLDSHPGSKRHKKNHRDCYLLPAAESANNTTTESNRTAAVEIFPGFEFLDNDAASVGDMSTDELIDRMDDDLTTTYIANAESSMDVGRAGAVTSDDVASSSQFPRIDMEGNEWLQELLRDTQTATVAEMHGAFTGPQLGRMKNFWLAELASGSGYCGGGLMLLVAKAFQQVRDAQLDKTRFPDFAEAKFHLDNLVQYQSMNEKQRLRQSQITQTIMEHVPPGAFLKETCVPKYNHLGKYYGGTGKHSLWENLPIPKAIDIDGVAYISPKAIIAFLVANGIPIDDIVIRRPLSKEKQKSCDGHPSRVLHIEDCKKAVDWMNDVAETYYSSNPGAPNSGAPKHEAVVFVPVVDWKDGFGHSNVKNNRGSVDVKTFTVSPPKDSINGTANTCAVALGLKNAKGWNKVEHMFNNELLELTSAKEPWVFYNGRTQKMQPMFFWRAVSIADKVEKPVVTGTISFASDAHRTYGVVGKVKTPGIKVEIKAFLAAEEARGWGWSSDFVRQNANGAKLPSCRNCRRKGLEKLGALDTNQPETDGGECSECANWDVMRTTNEGDGAVLDFQKHEDYPRRITEGSPVAAPPGRDLFEEGADGRLPFVKLDWSMMVQACKFAFFQASRPKKAWTKKATDCYLTYCGVNPKVAKGVTNLASSLKGKQQGHIDYDSPDGIGELDFPAAWLSELEVLDFIECVMHLLFLGIARSNFDLITKWLSKLPARSKMSSAGFRKAISPLLTDLKAFRLAWCQAYPFAGKHAGYGGWVSENWMTCVRLSKIMYAWCAVNHDLAAKHGVDDLSRMVISFHAFVARALTHNGINEDLLAEMELLMLEFLSCVREFDIRARHHKHAKKVKNVSERKGTEAWWLKPNYMSLRNLLSMMHLFGPCVLWWDGGGKGERFIQSVKPHIKRGVREDVLSFFVRLQEKLFKVIQMQLLEKRYGLPDGVTGATNPGMDSDDQESVVDILNEVADALSIPEDEESSSEESSLGDDSAGSGVDDDQSEGDVQQQETQFSTVEEHGMTKIKTIYIYRNEKHLNDSVAASKPLAGMVEVTTTDTGETALEFQIIFRQPVKQFARRKVVFNDGEGMAFHGLWWAGIQVEQEEESLPPTANFTEIQSAAKLSAIAIPLCYVIGHDKANSNKYCVITNWWKERMSDGCYRLPTLDASLYCHEEPPRDELAEMLAMAGAAGVEAPMDPNDSTARDELAEMLAVAGAGGVEVPLDPNDSTARDELAEMLAVAGAAGVEAPMDPHDSTARYRI
jgi:hypothetical protein